MMNPSGYLLSLLKIPVVDIEQSLPFYRDSLGFVLAFSAAEYGWAQFDVDGLSIALYQPGKGGGEREIGGSLDFHLSLDQPKFDLLTETLLAEGAIVDGTIHTGDDGTTFIDVQDRDGNLLKIFRRM